MTDTPTHRMPRVRVGLRRRDWLFIGGAVGLAVLLGWVLFQVGQQRAQVDALATALATEQRQVQDAGLTPAAPAPSEILDDPEVVVGEKGDPGDVGPRGPGPSDAQVRAAVEAYFATNPPGPTPAEIAAAVVNYLREHPPAAGPKGDPGEPGPGPTAQQVGDAVRDYLTANPPPAGPQGEKGDKGDRGEDGQDATPEMVAAAVEAFIAEHPLPMCPQGAVAQVKWLVTTDPGTVEAIICVVT